MKKHSLHAFGLILFVAFTGCEDSSSSTAPPAAPENQLPPTQTTIRTSSQGAMSPLVAAASSQTADAFRALFRGNESPDAADPMGSQGNSIREANAKLRAAWNADKTDSRAAFGAAITGIALKINQMAGTMKRAQDDLGLGGETTSSGTSFETATPTAMVRDMPVLARAVATPVKSPLVHELQDSLEQMFLPTLDESVQLLEASWSDSTFEFHVAIDPVEFPGDTLVIDRSDVGFALSILQALRAQIRWLVSYNVDIDRNGSYAWAETLSHVDDPAIMSPAQTEALQHLQSLLSNNSAFLKVRSGKEALLASVPTELKTALTRAREAAVIGYALKAGKRNHLPTIRTTAVRDSFVRIVDSGLALLAGPRVFEVARHQVCATRSWSRSSWNGSVETYSDSGMIDWIEFLGYYRRGRSYTQDGLESYTTDWNEEGLDEFSCTTSDDYVSEEYEYHWRVTPVSVKSHTIVMDLSKLLSLKDLKVFMPRIQWNPTSLWNVDGPISFVSATGTKSVSALEDAADLNGFDGVKNSIVWADPTFGGVFPSFTSSVAVLEFFHGATEFEGKSVILAARGPLLLF